MDIAQIKEKLTEYKVAALQNEDVRKQLQTKVSEMNNQINEINKLQLKLEGRIGARIEDVPENERENIGQWFNALKPDTSKVEKPKAEKADAKTEVKK